MALNGKRLLALVAEDVPTATCNAEVVGQFAIRKTKAETNERRQIRRTMELELAQDRQVPPGTKLC